MDFLFKIYFSTFTGLIILPTLNYEMLSVDFLQISERKFDRIFMLSHA